jgi:protein-S-isoprenylcysteine O-methyltransferase Ste14
VNGLIEDLRSRHRTAYGLGLALCLGTPGLMAVLILSGAIPPGTQAPEGFYQDLGYLFTGLVFLAAAWVWWRSGRALRAFRTLPEPQRAAFILAETLLYAAAFESSSLLGLVYWALVGSHAARHAWGFIVLTPVLFAALVPRYDRWEKALES